jgi:hypothetical protein
LAASEAALGSHTVASRSQCSHTSAARDAKPLAAQGADTSAAHSLAVRGDGGYFQIFLFFVFTITSTMLTGIMRPGRHPINNCTDILATPMLILIPVSSATLVDVDPTLRHAASDRSNSSLISVPAIAATISGGIFACLTCAMLSDKMMDSGLKPARAPISCIWDKSTLTRNFLVLMVGALFFGSCSYFGTYGRRSILWQLLILWQSLETLLNASAV